MRQDDLISIGKTLAEYRREQQLTQAELGRLTGIDRQTVSEIERGRFTGSLSILLRYLRYAGLELAAARKSSPFPELESLKARYGDEDD